mgnify:CR=1 FL=1
MALEDDFGYEVDKTTKKIKGKVSKPLKVKLMVKTKPKVSVKPKQASTLHKNPIGDDATPDDGGVQPN